MRLVRPPARTVAVALLLAGCGEPGTLKGSGPLQWKQTPVLTVAAPSLPDDRILAGTVVNAGFPGRALSLDATKVEVRDAEGRKLESFALFSHTYAHGLYGASEAPDGPLGEDRRRLGFVRKVPARAEAPLTVTYRMTPGTRQPLTILYGEGRLPVPTALTEDRG